jgi:hypothetical protein
MVALVFLGMGFLLQGCAAVTEVTDEASVPFDAEHVGPDASSEVGEAAVADSQAGDAHDPDGGDVCGDDAERSPCGNSVHGWVGCPEGYFCDLVDCNSGWCKPTPEECPDEVDEVCGCDGNTYQNTCLARQAGQSARYDDPCGATCSSNDDCGDDRMCWFGFSLDDKCGLEPGAEGVCMNAEVRCSEGPGICIGPVCGCDGVTYERACGALRAGVNYVDVFVTCEDYTSTRMP